MLPEQYHLDTYKNLKTLTEEERLPIVTQLAHMLIAFNYDEQTVDPSTFPDYLELLEDELVEELDNIEGSRTYTVIFARDSQNNGNIVGFGILARPEYFDENGLSREIVIYGLAYVHSHHRRQHIFSSISEEVQRVAQECKLLLFQQMQEYQLVSHELDLFNKDIAPTQKIMNQLLKIYSRYV